MEVIIFFLILFILFVCSIHSRRVKSPKYKGSVGEEIVSGILSRLPDSYFIFNDVVLETERGTTQIDHIVVSKYGIFAIETKNYSGIIYGDDTRKEWTQIIITKVRYSRKWYKTYKYITKNKFYNPVKQAYAHTYAIKDCINGCSNLKVIPIVVFTEKAELENIHSNNHVIYSHELLDTILGYKYAYTTDVYVEKIVNTLKKKDVRDIVSDTTHIRNIKTAQRELKYKLESGICPRCSGTLVERQGRYGRFLGCSNYPNCKFIANL